MLMGGGVYLHSFEMLLCVSCVGQAVSISTLTLENRILSVILKSYLDPARKLMLQLM